MEPIDSIEQLEDFYRRRHRHNDQPYFFVVLIKPYNTSRFFDVCRDFFDDFRHYHIFSGNICDFFMPGYGNDLVYLMCDERNDYIPKNLFQHDRTKRILERVRFSEKLFKDFVKKIEEFTEGRWKYKDQVELVLIKKDLEHNRLDYSDTLIFNLEDIVRQRHSVTSFIETIIDLSKEQRTDKEIKRNIYLEYWELTNPDRGYFDDEYRFYCDNLFYEWHEFNRHYVFISYCFQDKEKALYIRDQLNYFGIKVWMAPGSLPDEASYQYIIRNAIEHADAFLLVLSSHSNDSVWVEKETQMALRNKGYEKMIVYSLEDGYLELNDINKRLLSEPETTRLSDQIKSLKYEIKDLMVKGILPRNY